MRHPFSFVSCLAVSVLAASAALAQQAPVAMTALGVNGVQNPDWYSHGPSGQPMIQLLLLGTPGALCNANFIWTSPSSPVENASPLNVQLDYTKSMAFWVPVPKFLNTNDAAPGRWTFQLVGSATGNLPACQGTVQVAITLDAKRIGHPLPTLQTPEWLGENANGFARSTDTPVQMRIPPVDVAPCAAVVAIRDEARNRTIHSTIVLPTNGDVLNVSEKLAANGWKLLPGTYDVEIVGAADQRQFTCMGDVRTSLYVINEASGMIRPHASYYIGVTQDSSEGSPGWYTTRDVPIVMLTASVDGPRCGYQTTLSACAFSVSRSCCEQVANFLSNSSPMNSGRVPRAAVAAAAISWRRRSSPFAPGSVRTLATSSSLLSASSTAASIRA
jgi:hypothetical protein